MKKTLAISATLLAAALAAASPAASAFGLGNITAAIPGVGGGASASTVSAGDIEGFIRTAQEADQLIGSASRHIFKAVSSKEEIAAQEAKLAAANTIADPAEKAAALNKIRDDEATALQKSLASQEVEAKLDAMNKAQPGLLRQCRIHVHAGPAERQAACARQHCPGVGRGVESRRCCRACPL